MTNTIPAVDDPMFADEPWAPGYFTTAPGSRCTVFSYPGDVSAANCATEEQTKGALPAANSSRSSPTPSTRP